MEELFSSTDASAIVARCPFPLLIIDPQGRISGYNPAFARLVGEDRAAELSGREPTTLTQHPAQALLTDEPLVCWTDDNNAARHFRIHRTWLAEQGGSEVRFFVDVTAQVELEQIRQRLNQELQEQVLTDPVTGLLNSRGVMLALEPQVARSRRYNSPLSVLMLDFHGDGDRQPVLIAIARLLKDQLRWADLVACTEQQEFVLVLPETTAEAALKLADKLRRQLRELALQTDPAQSFWPRYGVTAWRKTDNVNTLLKRAAAALARAQSEQGEQLIAL